MSPDRRPGAARMRNRLFVPIGVIAAALMVALTLGVTSNIGVAGAQTPNTFIEVCKQGNVSNPTPAGFPFNINGGETFYVPVGGCSDQAVTSGTNKVTELPDPTGASLLQSITVAPKSANLHRKITNTAKQAGWAQVDVTAGKTVTTTFTNEPNSGQLKVCKVVAAGSPLIGTNFTFTEQAGGTTVGPFSLTAEVAGSSNPAACGGLTTYPVGTNVTVTEAALSNTTDVSISGVTVNGTPIDFNANPATAGGGGSAVATVAAGATTIVDVTNTVTTPPQTGYLEICKQSGDAFVPAAPPGSPNGWEFTISGNGQWVNQWVLAGQCSGDTQLPVGVYTVTEDDIPFPYFVSSITGDPTAPQSTNLGNGTGTFAVAANTAETATFTNSTLQGQVKVCKTLPNNSADQPLAGMPFNFNVVDAAGTQVVTVTVPAIGETQCSVDPVFLPQGSHAYVTEQSVPNVAVTGVSVTPASQQGSGTNSTTADIIVGSSIAAGNFTNEALGWVEVCKDYADASTAGVTFNFSVNGGPSFPVVAGQCSAPIQVPAGTATVQELETNADFYLQSVSAYGYPNGNELISGPTNGEIWVGVPYGGVGDETIATFTNAVQQAELKICTQESSADANLAGVSFTYDYSITDDGVTAPGSVTLVEPAAGAQPACSGMITGIPVVNPLSDGGGVPVVSITSLAPTVTDVDITNIQYQGNGGPQSIPALPASFPATQTFAIGAGANVSTWTNGRTA